MLQLFSEKFYENHKLPFLFYFTFDNLGTWNILTPSGEAEVF